METITIGSRDDFAQWAMQRANEIVAKQGSELATAARSGDEAKISKTANDLGQAIVDALMDSFDCLLEEEEG